MKKTGLRYTIQLEKAVPCQPLKGSQGATRVSQTTLRIADLRTLDSVQLRAVERWGFTGIGGNRGQSSKMAGKF